MKQMLIIVIIALAFLLASCTSKQMPERIWVKISQLQCNQNSWDSYLSEHNSSLAKQDGLKLVKEFYISKNVGVESIVSRRTMSAVCEGCSCPTGNTIYINIPSKQLKIMKDYGFTEISPEEKRIILIPNDRYCFDESDCQLIDINCCEDGKAFWGCFNTLTHPLCQTNVKCEGKKPSRQCKCIKNICD